PGEGPDPVAVAGRLIELGYTREPLVEQHGQFSLRGGILDVFPAAADAPVRAEWSGDAVETLRLFDPENQRSVMAIPDAVIRTGRELLIGPDRGAAAVERLHGTVSLDTLRGDVLSEWEDELTRLGAGAAFAGVEFYAAYLDPSRPSLLDHVPPDAVILDFEPRRQLTDARTLLDETSMLAAAEAGGGELPREFVLPTVEHLDDFGTRPRLAVTAGEGDGDAVDLGWFEGEPLVGQPRALAGFAARPDAGGGPHPRVHPRLRAGRAGRACRPRHRALQGHAPDRVRGRAPRIPRARVRGGRPALRARGKPGPGAEVPRRRGRPDAASPR